MEAINEIGIDVILMLARVIAQANTGMVVCKRKDSWDTRSVADVKMYLTGEDVLVTILFYIMR